MNPILLVIFYIQLSFGFLLCVLAFIATIVHRKEIKRLSFLINIQLIITSVVHLFSTLMYVNPEKQFFADFFNLFCLIGDLGKIAIAIVIMLLGQLSFVSLEEFESKKKIYIFISIFIAWILPLTISITAVTMKVKWVEHNILYPLIVTLRLTLVVIFFVLSFIVSCNMKKKYINGESSKECYNRFMKRIWKYRFVVIFHLVVLLGFLCLNELKMQNSDIFACDVIGYSFTSSLYIIGFVFNKEKIIQLMKFFTCEKEERKEMSISDLNIDLIVKKENNRV